MNMFKKVALGLTVASIAIAPIAASAAPTADLRASSALEETNELSTVGILALIAAIIGGIIIIADDSPSSP